MINNNKYELYLIYLYLQINKDCKFLKVGRFCSDPFGLHKKRISEDIWVV